MESEEVLPMKGMEWKLERQGGLALDCFGRERHPKKEEREKGESQVSAATRDERERRVSLSFLLGEI
jgi:hypothetical protein